MNSFSTRFTVLMTALFGAMVAIAILQFPAGARFMPLIVGLPGLGLCLLQLGLDARHAMGRRNYRFRNAQKAGKPEDEGQKVESELEGATLHRELVMWGYFLGFIAGVLCFGFYAAVPVMLTLFLRLEADMRLIRAAVVAAIATLALYFAFGVVLQIRLHPGFFTPSLLQAAGLA
ncbi:Tripartite tricarboxylate transporter TctB family protein [Hartmannibacter diazotrophicus]|uniref:Tripartite tricarboxylate transporter TctB family protein n=1 Tax=Hartmannibacter diazotrophicus TaxID=1482074 RepID=A0A2C9DC81_9HYPH|nr:tripartite tricarboxylate transporter TctB family protein [Hartmannibacter diazotrophicus]SON57780.1 Tripartite tricarboxylate transporter TctB family protein [Hartmannibacter diazotrophicus]